MRLNRAYVANLINVLTINYLARVNCAERIQTECVVIKRPYGWPGLPNASIQSRRAHNTQHQGARARLMSVRARGC